MRPEILKRTLTTGPDEFYVAGICPDFENGAAPIQLAFGCHRSRPPLSTFAGNVEFGEIVGSDSMAVREFDICSNGDRQITSQINRDIASAGFEGRIRTVAGRQELGNDSAAAGFGVCRGHSIEFNAAPAGLSFHRTLSGTQADASATSFHYYGASDIAEIHAAAAGGGMHCSLATLYLDVTATGFQSSSL